MIPIIVVFLFLGINFISAYQDNVEEGTYATYEFKAGLSIDGINALYCEGEVGWMCVGRNGDLAEMRQWISFSVPYEYIDVITGKLISNDIYYMGEEYVSMAKDGDVSFVPWFPKDNITVQQIREPFLVTDPSSGEERLINEHSVTIATSGDYYFEKMVYVDLSTREVYDLNNNRIGRWLWWINPEQYPYGESIVEVFRYDWCDQEVNCTVKYISEETSDIWYVYDNRFKGEHDECFTMNPWMVSCGTDEDGNENYLTAGIAYSVSSGMPIWARGGVGLQDDITYIMTNGLDLYPYMAFDMDEGKEGDVMFSLVETNLVLTIFEKSEGSDYFYLVLAAVTIVSVLMLIVLYIKRDML